MYKLLVYVFGVSFITMKKLKNNNFCNWCKSKNKINFIINKKIIQWMQFSTKKNNQSDQYMIDCIIEIVFIHYKRRVFIYTLLEKLSLINRKIFIQISFIILFLNLFGKLFRELFSFLYVYKSNSSQKFVNISLFFPEHSFSISKIKKTSICYSFGEYLNQKYSKTPLISFGEYVRHSKKFEKKIVTSEVSQFKRKKPTKQKHFIKFIPKIFHAFSSLLKDNAINDNIFFRLIYYRKYFYKINFMNMLSDINVELKNIENIFTLPFADIGLIKYDNEFLKKILAFSYSQNALIMPSPNLRKITTQKQLLKYMPLYHLNLSEKSYGFTSLYLSINKIKKRLNDEFFLNLPVRNVIKNEIPVTLGYEKINFFTSVKKNLIRQKVISIFDMPPISDYISILITTNGDKVGSYEFVENFMTDTLEACISHGFSILIKPKYSLINYNDRYGNFLKNMKKKHKDKMIVTNPYVRIGALVNFSCASINIPYTSPKLIFEKNNIPSIYYVPQKYKQNFTINRATDIKYGLSSLTSFIKRIDLK